MLQAPEHVFSAIAAKANIQWITRSIVLAPHFFAFVFPPVGNGIAEHYQIDITLSHLLQFFLVPWFPPLARPIFIKHCGDNGNSFVICTSGVSLCTVNKGYIGNGDLALAADI